MWHAFPNDDRITAILQKENRSDHPLGFGRILDVKDNNGETRLDLSDESLERLLYGTMPTE